MLGLSLTEKFTEFRSKCEAQGCRRCLDKAATPDFVDGVLKRGVCGEAEVDHRRGWMLNDGPKGRFQPKNEL